MFLIHMRGIHQQKPEQGRCAVDHRERHARPERPELICKLHGQFPADCLNASRCVDVIVKKSMPQSWRI